MHEWRITKYNPKYRDSSGIFTGSDWIIIQELGEIFNGKQFTIDDYLAMENRYITTALSFFDEANLTYLKISGLQGPFDGPVEIKSNNLYIDANFHEGQKISRDEISTALKMMLRETLGAKLEIDNRFYIHIGWDFYMYIGSKVAAPKSIATAKKLGLFVENFESPYS